jgi:hypothetical protein
MVQAANVTSAVSIIRMHETMAKIDGHVMGIRAVQVFGLRVRISRLQTLPPLRAEEHQQAVPLKTGHERM